MVLPHLAPLPWLPPQIAVALLAIIPVGELRVAIPVGIAAFRLSAAQAFLWGELGNLVPILLVYGVGDAWVAFVERRRGVLHRVTDRVLKRTHAAIKGNVERWGLLALVLLCAVPLPGTGAYTGALGGFVLGIPLRRAFPAIVLGNVIAGVIMALATTGAVTAFKVFL